MSLPESMRFSTRLFALVLAIMAPVSAQQAPAEFDLLITNGKIVNGTGNPWFLGDVGIRGDTIVQIGDLAGHPDH